MNKFKRNDDSRFFCRYCNIKSYKLDGIALKTHENNCSFNETNFNTITLKDFKGMLTKECNCPKCDKYYNKLKIHSKGCFSKIVDFSKYISLIRKPFCKSSPRIHLIETYLLSQLPFFKFEEIFENELIPSTFKSHHTIIK